MPETSPEATSEYPIGARLGFEANAVRTWDRAGFRAAVCAFGSAYQLESGAHSSLVTECVIQLVHIGDVRLQIGHRVQLRFHVLQAADSGVEIRDLDPIEERSAMGNDSRPEPIRTPTFIDEFSLAVLLI